MGISMQDEFWVIDVVRGQWGATKREQTIKQTAELDGYDVEILLEIEGGSGGKESAENTIRNLAGFTVEAIHPTGDKVTRASPFASYVGLGTTNVYNGEWTKAYVEELRYFPFGRFDDQVDPSGAAFSKLARKKKRAGGIPGLLATAKA